ncbi:hypothetical protein LCGC14_2329270 [marine sediment metagenome]|uniref:Uncharacterized protein n=1 Tax=marine sediment metagenome TaxID=412755 RepID=A0A0F9CG14_9ZZZZ
MQADVMWASSEYPVVRKKASVPDGQPNKTGGGPYSVWPHRDRNHLRHDLNISLQGSGIISAR